MVKPTDEGNVSAKVREREVKIRIRVAAEISKVLLPHSRELPTQKEQAQQLFDTFKVTSHAECTELVRRARDAKVRQLGPEKADEWLQVTLRNSNQHDISAIKVGGFSVI